MSGFSIFTIQYLLGRGAVSSEENIMPRNQKSLLGTWRFTCCVLSACFLVSVSFRPGSIGAQEGEMAESSVGVSLEQLDEISSECLESLVTTMFSLKLGLKEIGYEQAELFAAREGTLRLSRALAISDQARASLENNKRITWSESKR
jgi:hypothetical protein